MISARTSSKAALRLRLLVAFSAAFVVASLGGVCDGQLPLPPPPDGSTQPAPPGPAPDNPPPTAPPPGLVPPIKFSLPLDEYHYISQFFEGGHTGIDFAAPAGTAIYAAADGWIAGWDDGHPAGGPTYRPQNGNFVRLDHGDGFTTVYLHMERYTLTPKVSGNRERVRCGEYIGAVGNSGEVRDLGGGGYHLHFEAKYKETSIDPFHGSGNWPGGETAVSFWQEEDPQGNPRRTCVSETAGPEIEDIRDATISAARAYSITARLIQPTTPVRWSLVEGPPAMTVHASTGIVTWASPGVGSHSVRIRVATTGGFDDESWMLTVHPAQPANDSCANAVGPLPIPSRTVATTVEATPDRDAPYCQTGVTAPGVWYKLTGTGTPVIASLCNSVNNFDAKLSIYRGICANLVCVTAEDDCCGSLPQVSWYAEQDATYFLFVHGYGSATGSFRLDLSAGSRLLAHDTSGTLYVVDPDTGAADVLLSANTDLYDIAFSPAGRLYGLSSDGALYELSLVSSEARSIGMLGISSNCNSLVFDDAGTLWTACGDILAIVDPVSARGTVVAISTDTRPRVTWCSR